MHRPTDRLHLVRHGQVENPDAVVYAGLPGFELSDLGRRQAESAASWLAMRPVRRVAASPLTRAAETARIVARPHHVEVDIDERLTEWNLLDRWAGRRWADLEMHFPGEIADYLADPASIDFSAESLVSLAARVTAAVTDAWSEASGDVVVVGHQDPTQAALRSLTRRGFDDFHDDKPAHACVVTLAPHHDGWHTTTTFTPPQS